MIYHRLHRFSRFTGSRFAGKKQITQINIIVCSFLLLISLTGCEAFVRKFTRKPKYKKTEELVLAPEEYKDTMTPEEHYRESFTFWKAWQDELITSLLEGRSQKKKIDCIEQAIKNLREVRNLLKEDKQAALDKYIKESAQLSARLSQDTYGTNDSDLRMRAETIKRNVVRNFTYTEVKDSLR